MKQYLELLKDIKDNGFDHEDRTGTGRRSIFGRQLRFNLKEGFPLVTTRRIYTKAIVAELLWFIKGSTNVTELQEQNVHIWDKWAVTSDDIVKKMEQKYGPDAHKENSELFVNIENIFEENFLNEIGPMYGNIWRTSSTGIDQLQTVIDNIKNKPFSARHVVTAWLPEYIPSEDKSPQENVFDGKGCLAPCHILFQFFVTPSKEKNMLSMQLYQRSVDVPIGLPYNIAQYSLLLSMVAQIVDMEPYEFIISTGDTHIYKDQLDQVDLQLQREPLKLCSLSLNKEIKNIDDFTMEDIKFEGYIPHSVINYPVSK